MLVLGAVAGLVGDGPLDRLVIQRPKYGRVAAIEGAARQAAAPARRRITRTPAQAPGSTGSPRAPATPRSWSRPRPEAAPTAAPARRAAASSEQSAPRSMVVVNTIAQDQDSPVSTSAAIKPRQSSWPRLGRLCLSHPQFPPPKTQSVIHRNTCTRIKESEKTFRTEPVIQAQLNSLYPCQRPSWWL